MNGMHHPVEHDPETWESVRIVNTSAQHWIIVGACLGILAGIAVVAVALNIAGLI